MVALSSRSRYTVLHKTNSSGKMYHYGIVKSDMAIAYLKHMCWILSVYITKYTRNEFIQTVNGER